jgi:NAD(P)-dependent dehydrogenase (short-subunit alcohol dehydrogenase family)
MGELDGKVAVITGAGSGMARASTRVFHRDREMSGGPGAAERHPNLVHGTALERGGQPEEVAELASFLCSDRSPYLTGAVIPIDGGMTATLARDG